MTIELTDTTQVIFAVHIFGDTHLCVIGPIVFIAILVIATGIGFGVGVSAAKDAYTDKDLEPTEAEQSQS